MTVRRFTWYQAPLVKVQTSPTGQNGFNPACDETWILFTNDEDNEKTPNLKKHPVRDCSTHTNNDLLLKRIIELKSL